MPHTARETVTQILARLKEGDEAAADRLFDVVYRELRSLADDACRRKIGGEVVQPTSIVHDAYLRLAHTPGKDYKNRGHFLAVAAKAMRNILADRARRRGAAKRGGDWQRVAIDKMLDEASRQEIDLVALDDALEKLSELDERQAQIVELRFFGGLEVEETAEVLGLSRTTVNDAWRGARAWLRRELRSSE